jgi:hypothetical protein
LRFSEKRPIGAEGKDSESGADPTRRKVIRSHNEPTGMLCSRNMSPGNAIALTKRRFVKRSGSFVESFRPTDIAESGYG